MEIKIKIKIKDVEIEVEEKDLRELYDFLDKLYGKVVVDRWIPYEPIQPYYPWNPYPWTYTNTTDTNGGIWSTEDNSITISYSAQGE